MKIEICVIKIFSSDNILITINFGLKIVNKYAQYVKIVFQ